MNQPKILPRWYSVLFFTVAIILFIAAGALFSSWSSHASQCAREYLARVDESYSDYTNCASDKNGIWYGAVVCLVIGALFKLIAWICLILHCIQLRRSNLQHFAVNYHSVPPMDLNQQPYGVNGPHEAPSHYAPPSGNQYSTEYPKHYPTQPPTPMYPDTAYHGPNDVKSPSSNNTQAPAHYA